MPLIGMQAKGSEPVFTPFTLQLPMWTSLPEFGGVEMGVEEGVDEEGG